MIEFTEKSACLPRRNQFTHKGDYGKCLIIAGCVGYTGAASMAAHAAARTGAGIVFLGVPDVIYNIEAVKNDESVVFPLPSEDGKLDISAYTEIEARLKQCQVCLIGPGLGRSEGVDSIVYSVIRGSEIPVILDADGINAVSANINILYEAKTPVILTPHEGEFLRLGYDVSALGRERAAEEFVRRFGCTLVLKGHRTITALPDGKMFVNTSGNAGMAKGGSGDVLAGMLAALVGQGLPISTAAPLAVWLHGAAGDEAAARYGEYSMLPTDMLGCIGSAIRRVESRQ